MVAEEKTRVLRKGVRQDVTGLTVNAQVSVPRALRRRLRAAVHAATSGQGSPVEGGEALHGQPTGAPRVPARRPSRRGRQAPRPAPGRHVMARGASFARDVFHLGDCARMAELPDDAIDLVVAGPPYWNCIDYGAFAKGKPHQWQGGGSYEAFLEELKGWFDGGVPGPSPWALLRREPGDRAPRVGHQGPALSRRQDPRGRRVHVLLGDRLAQARRRAPRSPELLPEALRGQLHPQQRRRVRARFQEAAGRAPSPRVPSCSPTSRTPSSSTRPSGVRSPTTSGTCCR